MRVGISLMAVLLAGASLAACQRSQPQVTTLPLDTATAAAPLGEAPPPRGLPPAPPARIATLADYRDAYAYPDRAWGLAWAFGDSPPDYAFDDDGVSPWVWVADDDSECLAEPVPGGERYYYFLPGAYTPFYVQDPSYGYGFQNGQLAALYDRSGRQIAPTADPAAAATAGQYLARGRILRQAAASQPHRPVAAANWSARRGLIAAQRDAFARNAGADPGWRSYHDQHETQQTAHFAAEATRRESWAAQTDSRLGEPGRARREQRLAQAVAEAGRAGPAQPAASAPMVANRPPAATPGPRFAETGHRDAARASPQPALAAAAPPHTEPSHVAPHEARAERAPPQAVAERAPHLASVPSRAAPAVAAGPSQHQAAIAHAAAEHANDAAFHAHAAAAVAERHAAAAPQAFHASSQAQPTQHAVQPAKPPAPAAAKAAPPQAGPHGKPDGQDKPNGGDKHH